MNLEIRPILSSVAVKFLEERGCNLSDRFEKTEDSDEVDNFSISVISSVKDEMASGETLHGVIVMICEDGVCSLAHMYTDGTALVGSILYGAAWRAAKALGYKTITI